MSIFKDTLKKDIQDQLKVRQDALVERTPTSIQYLNARNAWIRMTSAVNTYTGPVPATSASLADEKNYTNTLAKQHVLQGGVLYEGNTARVGVGTGNQAYSLINQSGVVANRLGIRPMPGITGIDVKSKSAYGSLREVTVNFIAWDIRQLEELELLYMRPGYTVLVEWGWAPYLNNEGNLSKNVNYYDILNNTPDKETIFKNLYDDAVKEYDGNYDAMFGYVKNYSWSARDDGGYDCTTEIISVGEVMESLKVNYAPFNDLDRISKTGLIAPRVEDISLSDLPDLKKYYSKNVLAGLFYELYTIANKKMPGTQDKGDNLTIKDNVSGSVSYYDLFKKTLNISGGPAEASSNGKIGASDEQIYITLEGLCNVINNYVTFKDSNSKSAFVKCSVLDREYVTNNTGSNALTGDGYLLCLAHPLQLSVDPTVAIIKSPVWANGFKVNPDTIAPTSSTGFNLITFSSKLSDADLNNILDQIYYIAVSTKTKTAKSKQAIVDYIKQKTQQDPDTVRALTKLHFEKLKNPNYKINKPANVDLINSAIDDINNIDNTKLNKTLAASGVGNQVSLFAFLQRNFLTGLSTQQVNEAFGKAVEFTKSDPVATQQAELNKEKKALESSQTKAIENLQYLNNIIRPYFYQNDWKTELGIIGNIYVNLNFLFRLALDNNLESLDTKEKKDINLYNFLKSVLSEVSAANGNVNNFDLFVDPEDSKIYIIDINYVDSKPRSEVYENIFQLEMHNLKSTVRSYKLESQIFPDQSATVAIAAQVGGGAMATDNNTMLDFNKGLLDRIIPKKTDPTIDPDQPTFEKVKAQLQSVTDSLQSLYDFFGDQDYGWFTDGDFDADKASDYKNSLKDLINFFKNLTKSNIKNRAIIPTKLSVTMDGIGGLVIGHLFKIPPDLLPKGYQGASLGSKLGYTITGIGHSIKDNDWTTNIDAQTIILDNPQGGVLNFNDLVTVNPKGNLETKAKTDINNTRRSASGGAKKSICGQVRTNGAIEDILVSIRPGLYARHYSSVNQSDEKRIRLQPNAIRDLEALLIDAFSAGILIKVNSAYRTRDDQERIKAASAASGIPAATPGTSNHGFGLAVDLADKNGVRINPIKTPKEWAWIQENKAKYGFENINNGNESHHYDYQKPGITC
jgi:LAS superfamily LD-carboxypeptidase LdcB